MDGNNGDMVGYGQFAARKTYNMLGNANDFVLTLRSIEPVFELITRCSSRHFLIRGSRIEICNEVIKDLLFPFNDKLRVHEDAITKRVFFDGR